MVRTGTEGVRDYDFQRPHQLSRLELDALTLLFESWGRVTANFLSNYLRTVVSLHEVSGQQLPYEEYLDRVRVPTVLAVWDLNREAGGTALLQLDPAIALNIVDRALGGPGYGPFPVRELTEIEQAILRRILRRMGDLFVQTWAPTAPLSLELTQLEFNPAFAPVAAEGDLVVAFSHAISLDGQEGRLTWVWPFGVMRPLAELLTRHSLGREEGRRVEPRPREMERHLKAVPVHCTVVLGRARITLGDFDRLRAGDVLLLDRRYDESLELRVAGLPKFDVVAGRSHGHFAVRVIGRRPLDE
ncbi:Flagellar motor switch protein FliM [Candidatus Hydrogenisulfobacillus filiaventi]|uniref:Flagellar motor switch protein FliM n=1 Tax=Candidatus Hydrogenisulfobacillus filiaventi TaxID=2707344 RepID=A0A6F8ZDE6_9FIRM|nr:FliM/FliN family flagellar motor switch protein [Bacillota bacterium]CAB1128036.1 Flagellar motor switch protein FliM [Candidatus Hydrogenisulfobacillus filiaventi]